MENFCMINLKKETIIELKEEQQRRELAEAISYYRDERGITQEELSELANLNQSELCNIENGLCKSISVDTLAKICPYLNLSIEKLLVSCFTFIESDKEHFYDFEGNRIDLEKKAEEIYLADAELFLLLSSIDVLSDKKLIELLKKIIKFKKNK